MAAERHETALERWLHHESPTPPMTIWEIAAASGLYDDSAGSVNVTRCAGDVWDLARRGRIRRTAADPQRWTSAPADATTPPARAAAAAPTAAVTPEHNASTFPPRQGTSCQPQTPKPTATRTR